jgi:cellulose synthase/poly-beta-1,6-N-acetylglucosamine synthase-like glycosyltransferase
MTGSDAARLRGAPWTIPVVIGALVVGVATIGASAMALAATIALQAIFLAFFARHLAFALAAIRSGPADLRAALSDIGDLPTVTVLVACKNEEVVVGSMVDSLFRLDYPVDRLQFVVVDDGSDDRTGSLLDQLAKTHDRLVVVHRPVGSGGGKSGALNDGFAKSGGEVIVVFDADHQPTPACVRQLIRHFVDPDVAAVQGRCEIRNPDDSPLAHLVALDYMAGYLVNEYGRQLLFQLPAYGGANCAVRATDLRRVGGWNTDSVTEDTDLTLRLVLAGRKVRYDVTAVDREEAVVSVDRFWRQRYRWARGHQQVWRDYRSAVVRSQHLSVSAKVETLMFLLVFHLPALAAVGLGLLGLTVFGVVHPPDPASVHVLWTLLFLGPLLELGGGLLVAGAQRRNALMLVLFVPIFLLSMALCTKAWVDGVLGRPYQWAKTQRAGDVPGVPVPAA